MSSKEKVDISHISIENKVKNNTEPLEETENKLVERIDKLQKKKKDNKNQTPDIFSPTYNDKRNAYILKLNNKEIQQPKPETMKYYNVVYDKEKNIFFYNAIQGKII